MSDITIRPECPEDIPAIYAIHQAAFETPAEADLANALREQATPVISLVAGNETGIVGHILFSPVTLPGHPNLKLMGLAPMAVHPEYQRQGIGTKLVNAGIAECRRLEVSGVVVLGHPEFYPGFGFVPASQFKIGCEYDVPDDVFMIQELVPESLSDCWGTVNYHPAFGDL